MAGTTGHGQVHWVTIDQFEALENANVRAPFRKNGDGVKVDWVKVGKIIRLVHDVNDGEPNLSVKGWRESIAYCIGFDEVEPLLRVRRGMFAMM